MKPFKVALVALTNQAVPPWVSEPLAQAGIDFVARECVSREELAETAGDADVVWVFGSHDCLYAENLDVLARCGAIIRSGSGTDNIPVKEATGLGILVTNTPLATSEPVSDHVVALMFSLGRQIAVNDRAVRAGQWDPRRQPPRWHLHGQTVGLVGFGHIARAVTRKLAGFEVNVLAYDPWVKPEAMAALGVKAASLDEVLAQSDVVSVHTPLTPDTHHIISDRELGLMKPTALFINTSRGPVVDEAAVVQALTEKRIAGAGLDVFEQEPTDPDNPLFKLDNVVVTPHVGGYSDESFDNFWRLSLEAALDLAAGHWPRSVVNRGLTPRWQNLTEKARE